MLFNLGMRYLTKSANIQTGEDEKLEGSSLVFTIVLSLALGIAVFFLLPALAAGGLEKLLNLSHWWSNLVEGLFRLLILVLYMALVGRIPEIKRTFMYHGAEHKTINAFEAGLELTPENVEKMTTVHPRCGTSFILTLVLISVLFFSILGPLPLVCVCSRGCCSCQSFQALHMNTSALQQTTWISCHPGNNPAQFTPSKINHKRAKY